MQRDDVRLKIRIDVRIFLLKPVRDGVELGLRLGRGSARLEARDHLKVSNVAHQRNVIGCKRYPKVSVIYRLFRRTNRSGKRRREFEVGRHHSHNRIVLAIKLDRLVDQIRIAAKTALPKFIAQNENATRAGLVLIRKKDAASHSIDTQDRKKPGRDSQTRNALGSFAAGEVEVCVGKSRDV